ncbi:YceI family protein [Pseudomonas sp. UL073]|uniref:YceI family protein n=1 Tax=Zestomonas insulae TaxID=2809017 RepID=A0ABS2IFZ0_9GAMM|nr:YceI family protein [Pseudomonas insulae]MBM7061680.1 YceI family protein [Pseudomonas insulae]
MPRLLTLLLTACLALPTQAAWYLDNESSRISFVSTHSGNIAEVNRFLTLHGKISGKGQAGLRVELDSVSTGIPLRDERLRGLFFDTARFAEAEVSAQLDLGPITDLAPGAQLELRLPLTVKLHGSEHQYHAELLATRLDEQRFQVVTLAPLLLSVDDFALAGALGALGKAAGVAAIGPAVPVSAVLIFTSR